MAEEKAIVYPQNPQTAVLKNFDFCYLGFAKSAKNSSRCAEEAPNALIAVSQKQLDTRTNKELPLRFFFRDLAPLFKGAIATGWFFFDGTDARIWWSVSVAGFLILNFFGVGIICFTNVYCPEISLKFIMGAWKLIRSIDSSPTHLGSGLKCTLFFPWSSFDNCQLQFVLAAFDDK